MELNGETSPLHGHASPGVARVLAVVYRPTLPQRSDRIRIVVALGKVHIPRTQVVRVGHGEVD